jgi:hypothetical protein
MLIERHRTGADIAESRPARPRDAAPLNTCAILAAFDGLALTSLSGRFPLHTGLAERKRGCEPMSRITVGQGDQALYLELATDDSVPFISLRDSPNDDSASAEILIELDQVDALVNALRTLQAQAGGST